MRIYIGPYAKCFHNKDPFSVYDVLGGENGETEEMTWLSDDREDCLFLGPEQPRMGDEHHPFFQIMSPGSSDISLPLPIGGGGDDSTDPAAQIAWFCQKYETQIARLRRAYGNVEIHWGVYLRASTRPWKSIKK